MDRSIQPSQVQRQPASDSVDLGPGWLTSPYKHADYLLALGGSAAPRQLTPKARFGCAINLAWVDIQGSATPGVPVRMAAVYRLRDTMFKSPCPPPMVRWCMWVFQKTPDTSRTCTKGALKQVSPEEITAAYVMATARDVENQEADDVLMDDWAKHVRSSACTSIVLDSDMEMYWHAQEQRECIELIYKLARRSRCQRLHEIVRLMDRMRLTRKDADVTERVVDEYKANVTSMAENSGSAVTLSFVDTAKSAAGRMLAVPEIASCVADLHELMQWSASFITLLTATVALSVVRAIHGWRVQCSTSPALSGFGVTSEKNNPHVAGWSEAI